MPRRSIRLALLTVAAVLVSIWWLPALAARFWLPGVLAAQGYEATLAGVWPSGWLGVRIDRANLVRGAESLQIDALQARFEGDTWRCEARIAGGRVRVHARRDGESGLAYFQGVEIEPLVAFLRGALPIRARGTLRGAVRWSRDIEVSAHLRAALLDLPVIGILRTDAIDALVTRLGSGTLQVDEAIAVGPSGAVSAVGTISAARELRIGLRIDRLEQRLLELFRELRPDLAPPPILLEISGPAFRPAVIQRSLAPVEGAQALEAAPAGP